MREDSIMILAWKFNDTPGITTVNGYVRDWPEVLGPKPTEAQIDAWGEEYDAAMATAAAVAKAELDAEEAEIKTAFPDWAVIEKAIDEATLAQMKVIIKRGFKVLYNLALWRRKIMDELRATE